MNILGYNIVKQSQLETMVKNEIDKSSRSKYASSQIRQGEFNYGNSYMGGFQHTHEVRTFKMMRDLVSFLDASVLKRTLLLGDFEVYGEDDSTTEFLQNYKDKVREGYFGRNWINWMHQHADSVYAVGIGLSERVNRDDMSGAKQLLVGNPEILRFIPDEEYGYILGYQQGLMQAPKPFENQEAVYYTAFDKRYGSPKGYSLFHSLDFAVQLQTRMMQALHNSTWRMADPIFLGITKGEVTETYTKTGPRAVNESFLT